VRAPWQRGGSATSLILTRLTNCSNNITHRSVKNALLFPLFSCRQNGTEQVTPIPLTKATNKGFRLPRSFASVCDRRHHKRKRRVQKATPYPVVLPTSTGSNGYAAGDRGTQKIIHRKSHPQKPRVSQEQSCRHRSSLAPKKKHAICIQLIFAEMISKRVSAPNILSISIRYFGTRTAYRVSAQWKNQPCISHEVSAWT